MSKMSQSELAPEEDQGLVLSQVVGSPTATADQMQTYAEQMFNIAKTMPEYKQMFQITGVADHQLGHRRRVAQKLGRAHSQPA